MTLIELKTKFLSGQITIFKLYRMIKKFNLSEELDLLIPQNIPIGGKFHLYLYDKDLSVGFCEISQKARSLQVNPIENGFRPYCGNKDVCKCNYDRDQAFWNAKTPEQHMKTTEKRKITVQEKYGVNFVSELDVFKDKAA